MDSKRNGEELVQIFVDADGKDYGIVNNPNEFEFYVDGKKSKSKKLFSK